MNEEEKNIPKALKNPNPEGTMLTRRKEGNIENYSNNTLDKKNEIDEVEAKKQEKEKQKEEATKAVTSKAGESAGNAIGGPVGGIVGKEVGKLLGNKKIRKIIIYASLIGVACVFFLIAYFIFAFNQLMEPIVSFFGVKEGEEVEVEKENNGVGNMATTNTNTYTEYEGLWYDYIETEDGELIPLHDYTYPDGSKTETGLITMLRKEGAGCEEESGLTRWFSNLWIDIFNTFSFGKNDTKAGCRMLNYIWGTVEGYEDLFKDYHLNIDENIIISTIFYGYASQPYYNAYDDKDLVNIVPAVNAYETLVDIANAKDDNGEKILTPDTVDLLIISTIYEDIWPYWVFDVITRFNPNGVENKDWKKGTCTFNLAGYPDDKENSIASYLKYADDLVEECYQSISDRYGGYLDEIRTANKSVRNRINGALKRGDRGIIKIDDVKTPLYVGICETRAHAFYSYSEQKYDIALRYGIKSAGNVQMNGVKKDIFGKYHLNKYKSVGTERKKVDPLIVIDSKIYDNIKGSGWTNEDYKSDPFPYLYGSGYVYDANMNNSWINTDEACKTGNVLLEYIDYFESRGGPGFWNISRNTVAKFFGDRNYGGSDTESGPVTLIEYTQRIAEEDLNTLEQIQLTDINDRVCTLDDSNKKNNGTKITYEISYEKGLAYTEFPGFKKAADDENISDDVIAYDWNSMSTPKKVEEVIRNIHERKEEFAEVLQTDKKMKKNKRSKELTYKEYCDMIGNDRTGQLQVQITDCQGNYITTRSFKEYILGVVYYEIGVPEGGQTIQNDRYIITQMAAAINYTLGRRKNYKYDVFEMKSGSCDHNWCDIYLGCSLSTEGAIERKDAKTLLTLFPSNDYSSVSNNTCTVNGYVGKNYQKCPMIKKAGSTVSESGGADRETISWYSKLFETASKYLILSNNGYYGDDLEQLASSSEFNGAYTASTQAQWKSLAPTHEVKEILEITYPNSSIRICDNKQPKELCNNYNGNFDQDWNDSVVEAALALANLESRYKIEITSEGKGFGRGAGDGSISNIERNTSFDSKSATNNNGYYYAEGVGYIFVHPVANNATGESDIGDCSDFTKTAINVAKNIYAFKKRAKGESAADILDISGSSTKLLEYYGRCNCANPSNLKVGDIVFHRTNPERWENIGHVGIYLGNAENGDQLIFETNTKAVRSINKTNKKGNSQLKPAIVKDRNTEAIAAYVRWGPTDVPANTCSSDFENHTSWGIDGGD